jgi:DNA adenine methylase
MSESNKKVSPCFSYPGSKRRLLGEIIPLIPEHRTYLEPFAGSLAVLLAKEAVRCEIVNDINQDLITFYRYVKLHKEALFEELPRNFSSRADFELMKSREPVTELERVVRWYLVKVNSFGAQDGNFQLSRTRFSGFEPQRHLNLIEGVAERLRNVTIECRDWEWVVGYWDSPETFIFLDPPYVECASTAYRPFSESEMIKVRDRLQQVKASWILTCDNSPTCRKIFSGYTVREVGISYSVGTKPKQASEMIVVSPNLAKTLEVASA